MSGRDAIIRTERVGRRDPLSVNESTVFAIQIPYQPAIAGPFENQVLAGKPGILGIAQFIHAGPPERVAFAIQLQGTSFSIRRMDQQLAGLEGLDNSGH